MAFNEEELTRWSIVYGFLQLFFTALVTACVIAFSLPLGVASKLLASSFPLHHCEKTSSMDSLSDGRIALLLS